MAEPTFVVHDFTAYQKSWADMEKAEKKAEREKLRAVGGIVQRAAAGLFAPYDARSAAGYKVRVRSKGVAVEQSLRRTTADHPGFGVLQMTRALSPAAVANEDELRKQMEQVLDQIARREGF